MLWLLGIVCWDLRESNILLPVGSNGSGCKPMMLQMHHLPLLYIRLLLQFMQCFSYSLRVTGLLHLERRVHIHEKSGAVLNMCRGSGRWRWLRQNFCLFKATQAFRSLQRPRSHGDEFRKDLATASPCTTPFQPLHSPWYSIDVLLTWET